MEYWIPVLAAIAASIAVFFRTKHTGAERYEERLQRRLEIAETALDRCHEAENELIVLNKTLERQNAELRTYCIELQQKINGLQRG